MLQCKLLKFHLIYAVNQQRHLFNVNAVMDNLIALDSFAAFRTQDGAAPRAQQNLIQKLEKA